MVSVTAWVRRTSTDIKNLFRSQFEQSGGGFLELDSCEWIRFPFHRNLMRLTQAAAEMYEPFFNRLLCDFGDMSRGVVHNVLVNFGRTIVLENSPSRPAELRLLSATKKREVNVPERFGNEGFDLIVLRNDEAESWKLTGSVRDGTALILDSRKTRLQRKCLHTCECSSDPEVKNDPGFYCSCLSAIQGGWILRRVVYLSDEEWRGLAHDGNMYRKHTGL
jgi:hypothetical protein